MQLERAVPEYLVPKGVEPESRRRLSTKLCEAWQWKQPNGALRDIVCRGMLLMLDRGGQIELPPVKFVPHNPLARVRVKHLASHILGRMAARISEDRRACTDIRFTFWKRS